MALAISYLGKCKAVFEDIYEKCANAFCNYLWAKCCYSSSFVLHLIFESVFIFLNPIKTYITNFNYSAHWYLLTNTRNIEQIYTFTIYQYIIFSYPLLVDATKSLRQMYNISFPFCTKWKCNSFDTYSEKRKICEAYKIQCKWNIKGKSYFNQKPLDLGCWQMSLYVFYFHTSDMQWKNMNVEEDIKVSS